MRGENLRFFPELRHRVAKMLRVLAYDSGGAALPELLRPGRRIISVLLWIASMQKGSRLILPYEALLELLPDLLAVWGCRGPLRRCRFHLPRWAHECHVKLVTWQAWSSAKVHARAGKEGCVPWLVGELGNTTTHWCTRAELAAVLGSLARIPALSAAMVRAPCMSIPHKGFLCVAMSTDKQAMLCMNSSLAPQKMVGFLARSSAHSGTLTAHVWTQVVFARARKNLLWLWAASCCCTWWV